MDVDFLFSREAIQFFIVCTSVCSRTVIPFKDVKRLFWGFINMKMKRNSVCAQTLRACVAASVLLLSVGCATLDEFLADDGLGWLVTAASLGYISGADPALLTPESYTSIMALNEAAWSVNTETQVSNRTTSPSGSHGKNSGSDASRAQAVSLNCDPIPPRCAAANNRAVELLERFSASGGSIVSASSEMYCATLIGIEVNGFCADDYRSQGRFECAYLADQQVAEYRGMQPQILAVLDAASISGTRSACEWER
jgi:hypothetical protein